MKFFHLILLVCLTNSIDCESHHFHGWVRQPYNAYYSYGSNRHSGHQPLRSVVDLTPSDPDNPVTGKLFFTQLYSGVEITGTLSGLKSGQHGFHIHEKGDIGDKCLAAGTHYNPFMKNHGNPISSVRHVGDLGNIYAVDDVPTYVHVFDFVITLDTSSKSSVVGKTLIVHEKMDDLGSGNDAESLKTGNAGKRLACGVVKLA